MNTKPTFFVVLCGDWAKIISAFSMEPCWWELLLKQKPDDQDRADYDVYRLEFATTSELCRALEVAESNNIRSHVGCEVKTDDVFFYAESDDGWASTGAYCVCKNKLAKRNREQAEEALAEAYQKSKEATAYRKLLRRVCGGEDVKPQEIERVLNEY